MLGFLPYMNIPTRYILADTHIIARKLRARSIIDTSGCHAGMPNGRRAIITIGAVNGIIDVHTASDELGSFTTVMDMIRANMMGTIAIDCSCEAS